MATKKETQFALNIAIRDDRAQRLDEGISADVGLGEKVSGAAVDLLNKLADGGMMLTPLEVQKLRTALGEFDSAAVVAAAEKASGTRGGAVVVEWQVDPSWTGSLTDTARQQGMTLNQLAQQMMDTAVDRGWFYEMTVDPRRLLVSAKTDAYFREVLGRDVYNADDLMRLVKEKIAEADGELFGLATSAEPEKEEVPA